MKTKERNMMKLYLILALLLQALLLASCGDSDKGKTTGGSSEETKGIAITDKTVAGVSQKGPFVKGSAVHIYELTFSDLAQTGNSFTGKIASDKGDFKVKVARLASQFALLEADGYYRNEVTGELSTSPITLNAITNLSDRDNVNINLLTHLEYERVMNLVEKGSRLSKAKNLAEEEIFNSFYIEDSFENFEDLNIFNSGDGDAALLAISVLLQGSRTEAQLSELLAEYALDIEEDGSWDDELTKTKIADWAEQRTFSDRFAGIRLNVAQWGFGDVPNFEKYTTGYWWHNYGLGDCTNKRQNEVMKNQNSLSANVNVYYTCKNEQWFKASNLEEDTYQWEDGKEGDVKNGSVNPNLIYVFNGEKWHEGTMIDYLMVEKGGVACLEKRRSKDSKAAVPGDTSEIKVDGLYYVCSNKGKWKIAPDFYNDTYELRDSCKSLTTNTVFKGLINKQNEYLCENGELRAPSDLEKKYGFCLSEKSPCLSRGGCRGDSPSDFYEKSYICQDYQWKEIPNSLSQLVLDGGACTEKRANEVVVGYDPPYICVDNEWKSVIGECTSENENTIVLDSLYTKNVFICQNTNGYNWKEFSKVIYEHGECTSDKENKTVNVLMYQHAGVKFPYDDLYNESSFQNYYYICHDNEWEITTQVIYEYGLCTPDKENAMASEYIYNGGCSPYKYYFCHDNQWNKTTQTIYEHGLCTSSKENMTIEVYNRFYCDPNGDDSYYYVEHYICQDNEWEITTQVIHEYGLCTPDKENTIVNIFETSPSDQPRRKAYICQDNQWNEAAYNVHKNVTCSSDKENMVISEYDEKSSFFLYYICQNNEWEETTQAVYEYGLCTSSKENMTIEVYMRSYKDDSYFSAKYYICQDNEWKKTSEEEYEAKK